MFTMAQNTKVLIFTIIIVTVYCLNTGPTELKQDNQLGILYGFPLLSLSLPIA